jgi:hypothetical protein
MPGNWHIRFGGGQLEKCRKVTRWLPTQPQRAGKSGGIISSLVAARPLRPVNRGVLSRVPSCLLTSICQGVSLSFPFLLCKNKILCA